MFYYLINLTKGDNWYVVIKGDNLDFPSFCWGQYELFQMCVPPLYFFVNSIKTIALCSLFKMYVLKVILKTGK